jgi:hypothetical protein
MPHNCIRGAVLRDRLCSSTENFEHETKRKTPMRKVKVKFIPELKALSGSKGITLLCL